MVDPAVVREWIEKADEDFRFAEVNLADVLTPGTPRIDILRMKCYHKITE
jgi:hypothetical protein